MSVSYKRLWNLLIVRNISKAELRKRAQVAPNTMTRLVKNEPVSLEVLGKFCRVLKADFGDIIEYIPEKNEGEEQ